MVGRDVGQAAAQARTGRSRPANTWPAPNPARRRKRFRTGTSATAIVENFYSVARDYDQDRAKDDLTDNNLRIARAANPQPGQWVYVAMTEEHYPARLIKRIKDEFRLPREARGVILDHGRVVRLLVCGPQLEDWMLDVTLSDEPSVDVYVWNTMHRERLFKRAEEALRQARRWALSLIEYPPVRDEPFRGALL